MRLSNDFVLREMAGITVLLPLGKDFQGIMAVNPVGARILELLREGTTEENTLFSALCAEYNAPEEIIVSDAREFLSALRENGLLLDDALLG